MPKSKNLGKIAYAGYHTTRHPNYEKRWKVTPFEEISIGEQENWDDSADAVWDEAVDACIRVVQSRMPFMIDHEVRGDEAIDISLKLLRKLRTTTPDDQ